MGTFSGSEGKTNLESKLRGSMKAAKAENANSDLRVWCDICSIRVAPSEDRVVVRGKTYHANCYSKLGAKGNPRRNP